MLTKLFGQIAMGAFIFCEEDNPTGHFIQAIDCPYFSITVSEFQLQVREFSIIAILDGQKPARLINGNQILILI